MPEDEKGANRVTPAASGAPSKPTTVEVVMSGGRTWHIGESIGLSRGYMFSPGMAVEVTEADARILCRGNWDGRSFERVD